jgi:hypothetical protein
MINLFDLYNDFFLIKAHTCTVTVTDTQEAMQTSLHGAFQDHSTNFLCCFSVLSSK